MAPLTHRETFILLLLAITLLLTMTTTRCDITPTVTIEPDALIDRIIPE